jgi:MFS family permease
VAQLSGGAGTWNQRIAELWLVFELTGDGLSLGTSTALRTAPAIFLGAAAGHLADHYDRRRLLMATQTGRGLVGLAFALVTLGRVPGLLVVYGLVLTLGFIGALDAPIRRSFVRDVVEPRDLRAAASLHTATISVGRMIGPIAAGLLIAQWGVTAAFTASVVTAVVAVEAVRRVRPVTEEVADLTVETPASDPDAGHGSEVDAQRLPRIYETLILLAVFSTLGWNLDVALPVLAEDVLGRGPVAFSALVVCLTAIGATLILIGFFGGVFLSAASAAIQTTARYATQGRVIAFYSILFTGCRALGAPLLGWTIDVVGAREAMVLLGVATSGTALLTSLILLWVRTRE